MLRALFRQHAAYQASPPPLPSPLRRAHPGKKAAIRLPCQWARAQPHSQTAVARVAAATSQRAAASSRAITEDLCSGGYSLCIATQNARAHWVKREVDCKEIQRVYAITASDVPRLAGSAPPFGPMMTFAAARACDTDAQYDVGALYATGTGVTQSWPFVFEWYA